jgi:hypothetical protein
MLRLPSIILSISVKLRREKNRKYLKYNPPNFCFFPGTLPGCSLSTRYHSILACHLLRFDDVGIPMIDTDHILPLNANDC